MDVYLCTDQDFCGKGVFKNMEDAQNAWKITYSGPLYELVFDDDDSKFVVVRDHDDVIGYIIVTPLQEGPKDFAYV